MSKNLTCPFCGGIVRVIPCDGEGNYPKDSEYEVNPYKSLKYIICHDKLDSIDECPIAHAAGGGIQGTIIYDSPEEAAALWNKARNQNLERKIYAVTRGKYSDRRICAITIDKDKADCLREVYSDKDEKANIEELEDVVIFR